MVWCGVVRCCCFCYCYCCCRLLHARMLADNEKEDEEEEERETRRRAPCSVVCLRWTVKFCNCSTLAWNGTRQRTCLCLSLPALDHVLYDYEELRMITA